MNTALSEPVHPGQVFRKLAALIDEISIYEAYKERLHADLRRLHRHYQQGRFGFFEYKKKKEVILHRHPENKGDDAYSAYLYSLHKQIEKLLFQLFYHVYADAVKPATPSPLSTPRPLAPPPASVRPVQPPPVLSALHPAPQKDTFEERIHMLRQTLHHKQPAGTVSSSQRPSTPPLSIPPVEEVRQDIASVKAQAAKHAARSSRAHPLAFLFAFFQRLFTRFRSLDFSLHLFPTKKPSAAPAVTPPRHPPGKATARRPFLLSFRNACAALRRFDYSLHLFPAKKPVVHAKPAPRTPRAVPSRPGFWRRFVFGERKNTSIFVDEILAMEKETAKTAGRPLKTAAGIGFGLFSFSKFMRDLFDRFQAKQEPIVGASTTVPPQFRKLQQLRKRLSTAKKQSGFDSTLLAQEAKRVKKILEVEQPTVYRGSSLGLIANVTVKRVSLFLVDSFPEFFGFLYSSLRAANIKVLSNTYVNIMVLVSFVLSLVTGAVMLVVFFALNYALYEILLRSIIFSLLAGSISATIFYVYPFLKIKERRRSIMTNMPFSINHLASVSSSGVPPQTMFELIAASGEYGEVSVELKKVVDFTNVFGYDFLTAVKAVAGTTPSVPFKEFLEGLVSTIETGGDLDSFLRQKADEATLTYQLERQRYAETVSTYSDIYTGVVIAAPLFFVAALAMVNLLGGDVGGLGVDVLLALGAYVIIPGLNLIFLGFLQVSQPEA